MPMIPETAYVMLACARLGCPHSVVFAGFSAEALRDIVDCNSKWVCTADQGMRGGRTTRLKKIGDAAIAGIPASAGGPALVERCFVFKRTNAEVPFEAGRDMWMEDALADARPYCPPQDLDAEDSLFLLYTSGSTGKPKGLAHTTAGYLLYAMMTQKYVFDYREGDVYACVADCGWITGTRTSSTDPSATGAPPSCLRARPSTPTLGATGISSKRTK